MGSNPPWPPFPTTQDCTQGCSLNCPQWCYFLFPPPPSDTDLDTPTISPLGIALIALAAAAFILIAYYTIVYRHCRRHRHHPTQPTTTTSDTTPDPTPAPPSDGLDDALINKITVHRYRRGDGLVGGSNCSVCLTEFRDDDNLRLLPRCAHAFHVPCIDKWLKAHPNCPLCRAGIVWGGPPPPRAAVAAAPEIEVTQVVVDVMDIETTGEPRPKREIKRSLSSSASASISSASPAIECREGR